MAGTQTRTGVAVEVFVEENEVFPMRIVAVLIDAGMTRALPRVVGQKDTREARSKILGNLLQIVHPA